MRKWSLIFIGCLHLASCSEGSQHLTEKNPKIKAALERRHKQYAAEIMANCHRVAVQKADLYVDSLISAEIQFRISDSIIFPEKPLRPVFPGAIRLNDTLRARPVSKENQPVEIQK